MAETTLFDSSYETRKRPRLNQALDHLRPMYSSDELKVLRIDKISEEGTFSALRARIRQSRDSRNRTGKSVRMCGTRIAQCSASVAPRT